MKLWVLIFALNGHVFQTEPMSAEQCILTGMSKADSGYSNVRCLSTTDSQVMPIKRCEVKTQYYSYCKQ